MFVGNMLSEIGEAFRVHVGRNTTRFWFASCVLPRDRNAAQLLPVALSYVLTAALRYCTVVLSRLSHFTDNSTMRAVIQRVKRASVVVEERTVSEICKGLVCLIGIREDDGPEQAEWLCKQIVAAKLFEGMGEDNADKRWRSSVKQNGFEVLLVSQAREKHVAIVKVAFRGHSGEFWGRTILVHSVHA